MACNFKASYISCLDKSMSKCNNKFTFPGLMFVPRKLWPFGKEYHTIACGTSGILYRMEIVEGKDKPKGPGVPLKEYHQFKPTVQLLLRLTQDLHGTGKIVVLDSGFCVLEAIVHLRKKGVFAAALIKKRRYWPKHVDGDAIIEHFAQKEVGEVDAWRGLLDGESFYIYSMKEPDYVMSLMTTYGTLARYGEEKS